MQAEAPATEYVPALHETHVVETDAVEEDDEVPATQLVQLAAPVAVWYCPFGHDVHDD